jgi:hypothetical protein
MNSLAVRAGVAATTMTRLARADDKATSALSLDLASKIVTVLDWGIEDLWEVVEANCPQNVKALAKRSVVSVLVVLLVLMVFRELLP